MRVIAITGVVVFILCLVVYKIINKIFDEEWNKWGW